MGKTEGGKRHIDAGIVFECMLIDIALAQNGYCEGRSTITKINTYLVDAYTKEQDECTARWSMRFNGLARKAFEYRDQFSYYYPELHTVYGGNYLDYVGICYYDPQRLDVFRGSRMAFYSEPWFDEAGPCPELIYFDNVCARGENNDGQYRDNMPMGWYSNSVYTRNGVTYVDLELIGSGLNLKRSTAQYPLTSTIVAWAKEDVDENGDQKVVEIDWNGTTIRVEAGSSNVKVGSRTVPLGAAVRVDKPFTWINKGHLYVPMSFLTDVLGETVTYNKEHGIWFVNRTENISSPELKQWTLGMSAVMSCLGYGDPYCFGIYSRCIRAQTYQEPSPYNPNWPVSKYSYYSPSSNSKQILENSWGCTDGAGVQRMARLLVSNPNPEYPAWDLFRVGHLASWGYSAEYLTADEALALVKPAAQKLKAAYGNWDEAYADWLEGYKAFSGSEEEYASRKELYQQLKDAQAVYGLLFDDSLFQ